MLNKLKNMLLSSVDLVRRGANQEADICLFKSADYQEEQQPVDIEVALVYADALAKSIQSIQEDESLDNEQKAQMIQKSFDQYNAAVEKFAPLAAEGEEPSPPDPIPEPPVEKSASRYDTIMEVSKSDTDQIVEIEKYNLWHGKDGRFTSGPGGNMGAISSRTLANGGISVHVKTGKEPKDGYMVAAFADRAEWIKGDAVMDSEKRTAAIQSFMDKNMDVLSDPDNYLGTWFDPDSGNISLDISRNFSDKAKAIKYASEHNEKAIWDVKNMESIDTGGTGNNL